ncbi:MAG: hypothetical protein LN588_05980 [Rickettsia endosymbiont of Bryobia graminum]|nr:hypothetical protein [Rickettsia endosymbiont of Bryobia graminum]
MKENKPPKGEEAINKFLGKIGNYKDSLHTLINDYFQTITVNHFFNSTSYLTKLIILEWQKDLYIW